MWQNQNNILTRPTRLWWIDCWLHLVMESGGAGIG